MAPPERLTALDASFLYLERPAMHMHVAAVSIFDPRTTRDGRLRFEDVRGVFADRLHLAPRFRHKVRSVPLNLALPVWVRIPTSTWTLRRRAALPGQRRELGRPSDPVLTARSPNRGSST
jgi:hypothetical protein